MTIAHFSPEAWKHVFNTPLECGMRSTVLLVASFPRRCDLQRLVQYEYLLLHSGDIPGGPPSLHPPSPHRSGELLVRRGLVERGLFLMMSRGVICREFSDQGISYHAGEQAVPFLDTLSSAYTARMRQTAKWIVDKYGDMTDINLNNFMRENWSHWGAEFTYEKFIRSVEA